MDFKSSSLQARALAHLPNEVIFHILASIEDDTFLWTTCRKVSRVFRHEIEYQFRKTRLQHVILRPLNGPVRPTFRLSSLDSNHKRAFFKMDHDSKEPISPLIHDMLAKFCSRPSTPSSRADAYERVTKLTVVRFGSEFARFRFNDLDIPSLEFHRSSGQVSLDWRALFDSLYGEETLLCRLQAERGVAEDSWRKLVQTSPIVFPFMLGIEQFISNDNLSLRFEVRKRRLEEYFQTGLGKQLDDFHREAVLLIIRQSLTCSAYFMVCWFVTDLYQSRSLQEGYCRGERYGVEEPEANGWKPRRDRVWPGRLEWHNPGWEDPSDDGRLTCSEHPVTVEVEGMARAWERCWLGL